jgi:hypothetical protein
MIVLIAGLVTFVLGSGVATAGPASEPEPVEVQLEIDTRHAGAGADVLHRRIEERANISLRHAKVLPGDRDDTLLRVSVREVGGDEPGYVVTYAIEAGDGSGRGESIEVGCSLCTETELVAGVEAELDTLIPRLRELGQAVVPEEIGPEAEPEPLEPVPVSDARGSTGMLAGGVTLIVAGGATLGAGVALAVAKPKVDEQDPLDLITTRPVGYALLAGGVVLAATGAVLTALAIKQRRRSPLSVAPVIGRGQAGIMVGGVF